MASVTGRVYASAGVNGTVGWGQGSGLFEVQGFDLTRGLKWPNAPKMYKYVSNRGNAELGPSSPLRISYVGDVRKDSMTC